MNSKRNIVPTLQAVFAAILFGASPPISKLLLGEIEPVALSGFLYLGSGLGLLLLKYLLYKNNNLSEAKLNRNDIRWLLWAVFAGGVLAPIVLMYSLRNTAGATASLLLNFEGVSTTIIAFLVFKEAVGKRIWLAILSITTASIILSWDTNGQWGFSIYAIGVIASCILWGIDNNFTRNISAKDPLTIVTIKGLGAGTFSLILAIILSNAFPSFKMVFLAMVLGFFSYGLSVVLFVFAMRSLGAARTSAFFGTSPFIGALLSFMFLGEIPSTMFYISLPIMILGTVLLLSEDHGHEHHHSFLEHEHRHNHVDDHHNHQHEEDEITPEKYHSHPHQHLEIEHSHSHTPDIHHRHEHYK